MATVPYSTKLLPAQIKALKSISERTHVPQAVLVRQAIDMFVKNARPTTVSFSFPALAGEGFKKSRKRGERP